ncbi:MAG: Bro-N domain-containing protein [Candidatus Cryptobacteroides sp.]
MLNTKNEAGTLLPIEYSFSGTQVRTVVLNGIPYFVVKDVCDILQLTDTHMAIKSLEDDEKLTQVLFGSGQGRKMWLVNESGLYHLIFQSRKPEAKAFRKWVTSEVLPELRRTRSYAALPDVSFQIVNDRKMYPFHEMAVKLGYKSGSIYDRRDRYPGQFVKIGRLLFASEEMCRLMSVSRRTFLMRKEVAGLQPVLAITVSQLSLPM